MCTPRYFTTLGLSQKWPFILTVMLHELKRRKLDLVGLIKIQLSKHQRVCFKTKASTRFCNSMSVSADRIMAVSSA